jgi:hypothetical protein
LSKFWRIELPTNGLPLFAAQNLFNSSNDSCLSSKSWNIRVIRKVRKTQHQNPEFGNTQDEIQKKNTCKKVRLHSTGDETQKTINFGGKLSFILSFLFFLSASTAAATYIFTAPNYTTTITTSGCR